MSVHFVHGDKGGVGKSFVAASFVDWLIARRGLAPLVVDCDMRNPDIARMFANATTTQTVDLRDHEGWLELLSLVDESADVEWSSRCPQESALKSRRICRRSSPARRSCTGR